MHMIITIDGPAGTGKTTVARKVAEKLGFSYFDTGAMYRAITYCILKKKIDLNDSDQIAALLESFRFDIRTLGNEQHYFAEGEDVTKLIRSQEVTRFVSEVSANAAIRASLVRVQREFGKDKNSVFEGRDMGTVVFPHAKVKFFLTARPAVRAERRYLELKDKSSLTEEEVFQELLERDHFDSTREISPLKQAEDAYLVDTSDLSLEQVIDRVIAQIPT